MRSYKQDDGIECVRVPNSVMNAYRIEANKYKSIVNTDRATYSAANAKKVYKMLDERKHSLAVNLFIKNGYIFLFPESGDGVEVDLVIMQQIIDKFLTKCLMCI